MAQDEAFLGQNRLTVAGLRLWQKLNLNHHERTSRLHPLDYPHMDAKQVTERGLLFGCQYGEDPVGLRSYAPLCPGCRATMAAKALLDPWMVVINRRGLRAALLEVAIVTLADYPESVLFLRECEARGLTINGEVVPYER